MNNAPLVWKDADDPRYELGHWNIYAAWRSKLWTDPPLSSRPVPANWDIQ